ADLDATLQSFCDAGQDEAVALTEDEPRPQRDGRDSARSRMLEDQRLGLPAAARELGSRPRLGRLRNASLLSLAVDRHRAAVEDSLEAAAQAPEQRARCFDVGGLEARTLAIDVLHREVNEDERLARREIRGQVFEAASHFVEKRMSGD